MPTLPTSLPPAPPPLPLAANRATYQPNIEAWRTWQAAAFPAIVAVGTTAYNNAVEAANSASAAAASATGAAQSLAAAVAVTGASKWVSGASYGVGDVRYSPAKGFTYRRKTVGAGTTDPASDPVNWSPVAQGFVNMAVITASGPFVFPNGVGRAQVAVYGGGAACATGSGTQAGASGGGGAIKIITVDSALTYTAIIGAGGPPVPTLNAPGNAGGTSSFSGANITTISATGAQAGLQNGAAGTPGIGINGDINLAGGWGLPAFSGTGTGGYGGSSPLCGGNAPGGSYGNGGAPSGGSAGVGYGCGSGGVYNSTGYAGAPGVIIIWY